MIASLARAAQALDDNKYKAAAVRAADLILEKMKTPEGRLLHRYRTGDTAVAAHLDDYTFLTWGLIELYEATFDAALSQIDHRGTEDRGAFHMVTQENIQISLGHTRLSILDISAAGHQPMVSQRTGAIIVYNGEVYNFKEIRNQLEQRGLSFTSNCDTEVIIAAYDEYQEEFVHQLNGMFAIGILDIKRKNIILVRDRLGIKPLYYYWDGKRTTVGCPCTKAAGPV